LLLRELDGTATAEELAELREIVREFSSSEPGGRAEHDRLQIADEIVRLVAESEFGLSPVEKAELRHLFYSTHDPYLLLQLMRKVTAALKGS